MSRLSFTFDGKNSLMDFGIFLTSWPTLPTPGKRVHYLEIPGKDSSLWYDEGTFEDYSLLLECALTKTSVPSGVNLFDYLDQIAAWLYSAGESDLSFSFQPNKVRRAQVVNSFDFLPIMGRAVSFPVIFTCRPERREDADG